MPDALERLKARLADRHSLDALTGLLAWDQRTMMPPAGGRHRADHMALAAAALARAAHRPGGRPAARRARAARGRRSIPTRTTPRSIRVARRDYEKAVRVPTELRAEMTRAASEAAPVWVEAKATSDFELFLPVLERNVELRRRYIDCFEPQRRAVRHPARRLRAAR